MKERRYNPRSRYYKPNRNVESREWFSLMGISFITGAMLGATLALAWVNL